MKNGSSSHHGNVVHSGVRAHVMAARTGVLRPINTSSELAEDGRVANSLRAIAVAGVLGLILNSAASNASAADQEIAPAADIEYPIGDLHTHQ